MPPAYRYDPQNILAEVIRGTLPSTRILESSHSLAINDIRPQAPHHVLILPKGPYVCFDHFMFAADPDEIRDFFEAVQKVIAKLGVSPVNDGGGYRLITNTGADGFQEIAHFHLHILAGRWLGPLLPSEEDISIAEKKFGKKLKNESLIKNSTHD